MPEGDTIRNVITLLRPHLVGQRITRAVSRWPSAAFGLRGRTVVDLEPIGKNLWFTLDDETAIRVHLGMRVRSRADRSGTSR
jgi:formamidopyrimidine-DNA glycosylase